MKTACTSRLAFHNHHILIGFALYAAGLVLVFGATSAVGGGNAVAELSASDPAQVTGGTWTVTGDLHAPRADHTATLTTGGDNTSTTFAGVVKDGTSATGLTKVGTGILTLEGANTYTGETKVNEGTLIVGNSTGSATAPAVFG